MTRASSSLIGDFESHSEASQSPPPSASRSRRWDSVSQMDEDEDEDEDIKPTLKRSRGGAAGGARSRGGAENGRPVTKLTGGDKEQRKEARMVRNRNAAQASRDRKKEHTQLLEQRVTELEAQLESSSSSYPLSFPTSSRSNRSASIDSTCPTPQLVALEDENESLRSQLHFEQLETARLRSRLEGLEDKFARLEQFMSTPLAAAPLPSPSLPLPSDPSPFFEPTFTFAPQEETPGGSVERPATTTDSTTTDSSRLVAAEAVPLVDTVIVAPFLADSSHPSTPPSFPSHLDLDEFTIANVWGDWANGLKEDGAEADAAMELIDFSFHDTPVAISC